MTESNYFGWSPGNWEGSIYATEDSDAAAEEDTLEYTRSQFGSFTYEPFTHLKFADAIAHLPNEWV
jgi:hypothetical protein